MAKRVKTKKGSIGKKALAAILAASMVLSSSAFSVLAAELDVIGAEPDGAIIGADIPQATAEITGADAIVAEFDSKTITSLTYTGNRQTPALVIKKGEDGQVVTDATFSYGNNNTNAYTYTNTDVNGFVYSYDPLPGPYVRVDFSGSSIEDEPGNKIVYIGFNINQVNIANASSTKVTWDVVEGFTYNGKSHHPASIVVTVNGNQFTLNEGTDFDFKHDDVSANYDGKNLIYCEDCGKKCEGKATISGKGNFTGELTDIVDFHIDQKELKASDIQVSINENLVYQDGSGIVDGTTKEPAVIVKSVTDVLRASDDKNSPMVECAKDGEGNYELDENGNYKDGDFVILYEQRNGAWKENAPVAQVGTHKLRIVATGVEDYIKDTFVEYEYTISEKRTLRMAADKYFGIIGEDGDVVEEYTKGKDGSYQTKKIVDTGETEEIVYDGTDKFPYATKHSVVIGGSDHEEDKGQLIEGADFEVVTQRDEWIDAGTYELKLKGINTYAGQEATIKYTIQQRSINANGVEAYAWRGRYNDDSDAKTGTSVTVVEKGLDAVLHDNEINYRVLTEGVDYTVDTSKTLVEINGINNYAGVKTHVDYDSNRDNDSKLKDALEKNQKDEKGVQNIDDYTSPVVGDGNNYDEYFMPLSDSAISAEVIGTHVYNDKTKKYQLTKGDIKLTEGSYTLTADDYEIIAYEQDGIAHAASCGLPKSGEGYVIVAGIGGGKTKKYGGFRKIGFGITGTTFKDIVKIMPMKDIKFEFGLHEAYNVVSNKVYAADIAAELELRYVSNNATYADPYKVEVYDSEGHKVISYSYENNTLTDVSGLIEDAGQYTVRVIPTDGRYEGYAEATLNVLGADLNSRTVVISDIPDQEYTGSEITPDVTVTLVGNAAKNDIVLKKDIDYEVKYEDNVNAGTAVITITGKGNYSGTLIKTFKILGVDFSAAEVQPIPAQTYTGKAIKPSVTVTFEGKALVEGTDYTVSYTDNTEVGTATATVTGAGRYIGSKTVTFEIKAGATPKAHLTLKHYSTKAKTFGLTTNKVAGATKWQVRYSTKKNMAGKVTKTFTKKNRLYHKTITAKKSKTKYYVRVRAYVNGMWTAWSEKEHIKSR